MLKTNVVLTTTNFLYECNSYLVWMFTNNSHKSRGAFYK
jgi:hypothetical protein